MMIIASGVADCPDGLRPTVGHRLPRGMDRVGAFDFGNSKGCNNPTVRVRWWRRERYIGGKVGVSDHATVPDPPNTEKRSPDPGGWRELLVGRW